MLDGLAGRPFLLSCGCCGFMLSFLAILVLTWPTLHLVVFFVLTKVGICIVSMALVSSVDVNVGESTHTI